MAKIEKGLDVREILVESYSGHQTPFLQSTFLLAVLIIP